MTEQNIPVFVYGTLRHGLGNYERILAGQTLHEEPATLTDAQMFDGGGCPFVTRANGGHVVGEVMYLDPETALLTMQRLDRLEGFRGFGHPHNMYDRTQVTVQRPDGTTLIAWTYLSGAGAESWLADMPLVTDGDWKQHQESKTLAVL